MRQRRTNEFRGSCLQSGVTASPLIQRPEIHVKGHGDTVASDQPGCFSSYTLQSSFGNLRSKLRNCAPKGRPPQAPQFYDTDKEVALC